MALLAFGINHKTASVALRERAAFAPEALGQALRDARQFAGLDEVAILSTCNRTEFYGAADPERMQAVRQWLTESRGISDAELDAVWYVHEGEAAMRHAMLPPKLCEVRPRLVLVLFPLVLPLSP